MDRVFKYKNRRLAPLAPFACAATFFSFAPISERMGWIWIVPSAITAAGALWCYRRMSFEIRIDETSISIGKSVIPWKRVEKGLITKHRDDEGRPGRTYDEYSIAYADEGGKRRVAVVRPVKMEKTKALIGLLKEKVDFDRVG